MIQNCILKVSIVYAIKSSIDAKDRIDHIAFDKQYKRTISVDIRFVLWCIDVIGGAKNLIDELDIKTNKLAVPKDKLILKKQ